MTHPRYHLVLASGSPRRKELLGHLGLPFSIIVSNIKEESPHADPVLFGEDIARQKGQAIYQQLSARDDFGRSFFPLIISADTLVALDRVIYGKPRSRESARQILSDLSGKTHQVVTSVFMSRFDVVKMDWIEHIFSVKTDVTFATISKDILDNYIATDDSLDKAGAYGIQREGLTFVERLEGSYSNVVGFPLTDFINELRGFLTSRDDHEGLWREFFAKI